MELLLDATQSDLQHLVRAYLDDKWPVGALMDTTLGRPGASTVPWAELAGGLELTGLAVPESYGGSGCSVVELAVVVGELGRGLYMGPYLSTAGLAVSCLVASDDEGAMSAYLPAIVRGELTVALVGLHELMVADLAALPNAQEVRGSWVIDGATRFAFDCVDAGLLIVFANTAHGLGAFVVDPRADGVTITAESSLDLTRPLFSVRLAGTPADPLGAQGAGAHHVATLRITAAVLQASEAAGAAERCLELAVAYAKERVQFGRAIGSFQSIKHRCADMLLSIESAKAAQTYAVRAVATQSPDALSCALNASAACSDALYRAATSAGQVFGGIGYTWEHPMHLYLRRAVTSRFLFGTPQAHRAELLQQHIDGP